MQKETLKVSQLRVSFQKAGEWIRRRQFAYQLFWIIIMALLGGVFLGLNFFYNATARGFVTIDELQQALGQNRLSSEHFIQPIGSAIVGFSLPIVGLCMQTTTRNALSEPTTLGFFPLVTTGIMVTQLTSINAFSSKIQGVPDYFRENQYGFFYLFSIAFSMMIVLLNYILTRGTSSKNGFKSVLIGFAVSAIFIGINSLIRTYVPGVTADPISWLSSQSPVRINNNFFITSGVLIAVSMVVVVSLSAKLTIIRRDWLLAKALGIKVDAIYWTIAITSVLITVSSMLLIGGVILIGLVVPHMIRFLTRSNNFNFLLPATGIGGIMLLNSSDLFFKATGTNINLLIVIFAIPFLAVFLTRKGNLTK